MRAALALPAKRACAAACALHLEKNKMQPRMFGPLLVVVMGNAGHHPIRTGTKILSSPRWIKSATDFSDFATAAFT